MLHLGVSALCPEASDLSWPKLADCRRLALVESTYLHLTLFHIGRVSVPFGVACRRRLVFLWEKTLMHHEALPKVSPPP